MNLLAFDVGAKRIGVAISRSGIIAEPLTTIRATDHNAQEQLRSLVAREQPDVIVVGQPDQRPELTDHFILQLQSLIGENVKIVTVDETLTTKEAERLAGPTGDSDAVAAALILEQYLADQGRA